MFSHDDLARLAEMRSQIKGRFLLSLNDVPEVRAVFAALDMAEVRTCYAVNVRREGIQNAELLISNTLL